MSERTFESAVFVRTAEGLIHETACLANTLDFLDEMHSHRREVMCNTGTRAYVPLRSVGHTFTGFAHSAKVLEDASAAIPRMASAMPGQIGGVAA